MYPGQSQLRRVRGRRRPNHFVRKPRVHVTNLHYCSASAESTVTVVLLQRTERFALTALT